MALASFLALSLGTSAANAAINDLELRWWVNGSVAGQYTLGGAAMGNGMYNFAGNLTYLNPLNPFEQISLGYNLNGKPDWQTGLLASALLSGNLTVENTFLNAVDVQLQVILPIVPLSPTTEVGGSAAVGLTTDSGGGSVSTLANTPLWQALIDNSTVAELFDDPFDMTIGGLGSMSTDSDFGLPVPIGGPQALNDISVSISFNVTSLDQVSITSVFAASAIPAPGGLLVLVTAGLVVRRRRRA
jgi:hypothetical protein